MEAVKRCPPFCERLCQTEHHPLLVAFLNYRYSDADNIKHNKIAQLLDKLQREGSEVIPDPDPNYRFPPVLWACALGNTSLVKVVLDHGYSAMCQHRTSGDTGLHRALLCLPLAASQKESVSKFKELLPLMKDSLLLKNRDGLNVFILACRYYDDDIMMAYYQGCVTEILEFAKLDVGLLRSLLNSTTNDGQTAFHILAKHDRNSRLIKKLMDSRCADLSIQDSAGCTPTDIAVCGGQHLNASFLYGKMKKSSGNLENSGVETNAGSSDHSVVASRALSKELVSPRTPRTIKSPAYIYDTSPKSENRATAQVKSSDLEAAKSHHVSLCDTGKAVDVVSLKSCDATVKSCDVTSVKSCDVTSVKSCDTSVKSCDVTSIKSCVVTDTSLKSCDTLVKSYGTSVKSCDTSVKSCDTSVNSAVKSSAKVDTCDIKIETKCAVSPLNSGDNLESCDDSTVMSDNTVKSCDMPHDSTTKKMPTTFPRISLKRLLNKTVTEALPKHSIYVSTSHKKFISILPDIAKLKSNLNSGFNNEKCERKSRKRTLSENDVFTEIGNKIEAKNTTPYTVIRTKKRRLTDENMNTVNRETSVRLASLPAKQTSTLAVCDISNPQMLLPESDVSKETKTPKVKAIWNAYINYCAKKMPESADFILQLPITKLSEALVICPRLRGVLIQHVENVSRMECGVGPEILDLLYMTESEVKAMRLVESEVVLNGSRHSSIGPSKTPQECPSVPDSIGTQGYDDSGVNENMDDLEDSAENEDAFENDRLDYLDDTLVDIEREVLENDERQALLQEELEAFGRARTLMETSRETLNMDKDNQTTDEKETNLGNLSELVTTVNVNCTQIDELSVLDPALLVETRHNDNVLRSNRNECGIVKSKIVTKVKRQSKNTEVENKKLATDSKDSDCSHIVDQNYRKRNSLNNTNKMESKRNKPHTITGSKPEKEIDTHTVEETKTKSGIGDDEKIPDVDGKSTLEEHSYMKSVGETTTVDNDIEMEHNGETANQDSNIQTKAVPESLSTFESQSDNGGHVKEKSGETLTLILPDGVSTVVLVKNGRRFTINV